MTMNFYHISTECESSEFLLVNNEELHWVDMCHNI